MRRRAFLSAVTGGLLAAPLAAEAKPPGKVYRIGFLSSTGCPIRPEIMGPFRQGLATHLLEDGHDIPTVQALLGTATCPRPRSTRTS